MSLLLSYVHPRQLATDANLTGSAHPSLALVLVTDTARRTLYNLRALYVLSNKYVCQSCEKRSEELITSYTSSVFEL